MPPPVGGATVLFRQLVQELSARADVTIEVLDTSRGPGVWNAIWRAAAVLYQMTATMHKCDIVSFHSSRRGAVVFGPIVLALTLIFKKPWIFRGFGNFESWYKITGSLNRKLFRMTTLRANIVLLETRASVAYFRSVTSSDVRWYPNSRPYVPDTTYRRPSVGKPRFVFIGHVKPSKGIRELIAASDLLGDVTVDVYGPLLEGINRSEFRGTRARYCGALKMSEVAAVLRAYDVLVVPTYYEGEGYPGVILEAYAQGLLVIASRWRAIPEIVTSETGILIEPRDVLSLAEAMNRMLASSDLLSHMRVAVDRSAKLFASQMWTNVFATVARELHEFVAIETGFRLRSRAAPPEADPASKIVNLETPDES